MQAYQSPPCPHCGATWNRPDSRFCQDCHQQLATVTKKQLNLKPAIVVGGLALLLLGTGELAILPGLVTGWVSSDRQALAAASSHQSTTDETLKLFLTHYDSKTKTGGVGSYINLQGQFQSSLDTARHDQEQIALSDQNLMRFRAVAFSSQAEIDLWHVRNAVALAALKQGEGALGAAVHQAAVMASIKKAADIATQMDAAAIAKDFQRMQSLYPDADRALVAAESASLSPDMPAAVRNYVHSTANLVSDLEALAVAATNHDNVAGHVAYTNTVADIKIQSKYEDASFFAQWEDWNTRNIVPILKAYDDGLSKLNAAS